MKQMASERGVFESVYDIQRIRKTGKKIHLYVIYRVIYTTDYTHKTLEYFLYDIDI